MYCPVMKRLSNKMISYAISFFSDYIPIVLALLPLLYGIYRVEKAKGFGQVAMIALVVLIAKYILKNLGSSLVMGVNLFPSWQVVFNLVDPFFITELILAFLEVFAVLACCYVVYVKPTSVTA
jgi:hypothetical protein